MNEAAGVKVTGPAEKHVSTWRTGQVSTWREVQLEGNSKKDQYINSFLYCIGSYLFFIYLKRFR